MAYTGETFTFEILPEDAPTWAYLNVELAPVLKARFHGPAGGPGEQKSLRLRAVVSLIDANDENNPVDAYLKGTKRVPHTIDNRNAPGQISGYFAFPGLSITQEGFFKLRVDLWKKSRHTNQPDQKVTHVETSAFPCIAL